MLRSELIPHLMFDYEQLTPEEVKELCRELPLKLIRWIAINHPDNRSRLLYYQLTNVPIGKGTVINSGVKLYDEYRGLVSFGERVAVASDVNIIASSNPNNSKLVKVTYVREHLTQVAPIIIEDDAWIGAQVVILPGVTIGKGAIVGAGAVVVRDVAPDTAVAGAPARLIRSLSGHEHLFEEIHE